jgi:hypothetical protein
MGLGTVFFIICFSLFTVAYDAFSWGLVTWKFWAWFVLPVFPAFPVLTFIGAVGLSLFIGLFKNQTTQVLKSDFIDEGTTVGMVFLMPWLTLLCGLIIHAIIS